LGYKIYDENVKMVEQYLNNFQNIIWGKDKDLEKERTILPREIIYLEIVDRKCFAYLDHSIWQIDYTISTFLEHFSNQGFVRISKSQIVNIYHIKELKAEFNMRVNISLKNGETVVYLYDSITY
jgi:DNA-binding LytR/AlgR family response regulator